MISPRAHEPEPEVRDSDWSYAVAADLRSAAWASSQSRCRGLGCCYRFMPDRTLTRKNESDGILPQDFRQ